MTEMIAAALLATFAVMKTVVPSLALGLFLANLSVHGDFAARGRRFIPLITRLTGLPAACALSVILAVGDRTAGMAAVAQARTLAGLSDREVIAANLVAKAPSVLQFFLFSFIPVMVALYPRPIAIRFLTVYFLAFVIISLVGIGYARLIGRRQDCAPPAVTAAVEAEGGWQAVATAATEVWRPLLTMSWWMAGMSFAVMLLIQTGYLDRLTDHLPLLARLGLDANMLSLAGVGLVSMMGGVAAAGAALQAGALPSGSVVPLLLTISVLHNLYDLFAAALPRYMAIFGHRLGLKVSLAGFAVTQAVMLAMLAATILGWI
ncbi:MAG: hypothetical protein P4N59_32515 [Negativicutes bacterium]|nr:hypothetical protein [Negativicutes bacterium]